METLLINLIYNYIKLFFQTCCFVHKKFLRVTYSCFIEKEVLIQKVAYRWLMIIDSPVLSNTCYWSLMVSWCMWGLMWGRWSRRRPSSRDKKSVWAPQIEAVRTRRTVDMFKGARTQIPLVIKLNCNCHTLFIRKIRCAAQTSSTSCGSPSFSIEVFQISSCCSK